MKTKNVYGVFTYDKNDENIAWEHFTNKKQAMKLAKEFTEHLELGQYVEVWIADENGLFGNSGIPVFKSDGFTTMKKFNVWIEIEVVTLNKDGEEVDYQDYTDDLPLKVKQCNTIEEALSLSKEIEKVFC